MKPLIPLELYAQYKEAYSENNSLNTTLFRCKLFDPCSQWTWYVADYDPEAHIAFGYVIGPCPERGDFDISELEAYQGRLGLGIERDLYYTPTTYAVLYANNQLPNA